jgi:serine protease Do
MSTPGPDFDPSVGSPSPRPDEVQIVWRPSAPPSSPKIGLLDPQRRPVLIILAASVVVVAVVIAAILVFGDQGSTGRATGSSNPGTSTGTLPGLSVTPTADSTLTPPSPSPTPTPHIDLSGPIAAASASVVRVVASTCQGTGVGTGFWIDAQTVVTSYQSVARAVSVAVVLRDGTPLVADVIGTDPATGVALLTVGDSTGPTLAVNPGPLSPGDQVAWVGLRSKTTSVSSGTAPIGRTGIAFDHRKTHISGLAQVPGRVDLGLGGAPVVGQSGVVGAIFALPDRDQRLVVPGAELQQGIQRAQAAAPPDDKPCKWPTGPYSQMTIEGHAPAAMMRGLRAYFGGINKADYQHAYDAMGWGLHSGPVVPEKTSKGWRSTYDFHIRIHSTKGGSSPRAWVTFDSIFGLGMGVPGLSCARWSNNYTFISDGNRLEINASHPHGGKLKSWVPC